MSNTAVEGWVATGYQAADTPRYEVDRLAAVRELALLDTPPTESYDQLTRLLAKALKVPIVLVTLVDEHRQWFKSRVGLEMTQTTRSVSFCAHVMVSLRPLVIGDTSLDSRFAGNPLVMGAPNVRAYAGMPLFTRDGHAVGTVCVIDQKPRDFSDEDLQSLRDGAALVQGMIYAHEVANQTQSVLQFSKEREKMFRESFEQAAAGIIHCSPGGELLRANQRISSLLGYSSAELRALTYADIVHPDDVATSNELLENVSAGALDDFSIETRFLRKDGTALWTYLSMAVKRAPSGVPDYFIAVIEDITTRKKAEFDLVQARDSLTVQVAEQTQRLHENNIELRSHVKKLLESERKLTSTERWMRSIANCMPVLMGYWDRDLRCEFANEAYREWFKIPPEKVIGMSMTDLMGDGFPDVESHVLRALEGKAQQFTHSGLRPDGTPRHSDVRYQPDLDEQGEVRGFFVLVTDITTSRNIQLALEAANARLSSDGNLDYLTGIANRRHFTERGEAAAQQYLEQGETYGVILLDLDDFKLVNDSHGFAGGDDLLRRVSDLLKGQLRGHRDVVARLGGGRFAILCFGELDPDLLILMAQDIRSRIGSQDLRVDRALTATLGATLSAAGDSGFQGVYCRAESALLDAKTAGKNCVVVG